MKICKYLDNQKWVMVKFYGVFQHSKIIPPSGMLGGHQGGTIMFPVAVIEDKKGFLHEVEVWRIKEVQE